MNNKIIGNIVGLPSPRSDWNQTDERKADFIKNKPTNLATKEYVDKDKEAIKFANGLSIESREDGIYLVDSTKDEENEIILYSGGFNSYVENAEYASYASEAGLAENAVSDTQDRMLKGTEYGDYGDCEDLEHNINDGQIISYGIVGSLIANINEYELDMTKGLTSGLHFTTPSVIPENYTQFPDIIYFKGDSTDEGAFVPETNTRYTIVFDYDGNLIIGYVSGVPAPPVREVTE